MTRELPYVCRFCRTARVAEYDDTCPPLNLPKWAAMLACEHCHDYHVARTRVERGIAGLCFTLSSARAAGPNSEAKVRDKIASMLEGLTKRYATICCEHLRLTNVWDADWPAQLVERPEKCDVIMRTYLNGLREIKTQLGVKV